MPEDCSLNTERAEVKLTEEAAEPLSVEAGEIPAKMRTTLACVGADKGVGLEGGRSGQDPVLQVRPTARTA